MKLPMQTAAQFISHGILWSVLPLLIIGVWLVGCKNSEPPMQDLFNGKDLDGWDTFLRDYVDDTTHRDSTLGLNRDPYHVFSVVTVDNAPAIRISGEYYGGISTKKEFANYHLTLQFRWGKNKIESFRKRKRDSGLLYHAVGPHGVGYGSWMRSQEFQIQETDCGDYWQVGGSIIDIPASLTTDSLYIYDPKGTMTTFSAVSPAGMRCTKRVDAERPYGEWNQLDLYCLGDTSVHVVNGVVSMVLYRSRQPGNSGESPLKAGKIQIQSEGNEVYYRNIRLESIQRIPDAFLE